MFRFCDDFCISSLVNNNFWKYFASSFSKCVRHTRAFMRSNRGFVFTNLLIYTLQFFLSIFVVAWWCNLIFNRHRCADAINFDINKFSLRYNTNHRWMFDHFKSNDNFKIDAFVHTLQWHLVTSIDEQGIHILNVKFRFEPTEVNIWKTHVHSFIRAAAVIVMVSVFLRKAHVCVCARALISAQWNIIRFMTGWCLTCLLRHSFIWVTKCVIYAHPHTADQHPSVISKYMSVFGSKFFFTISKGAEEGGGRKPQTYGKTITARFKPNVLMSKTNAHTYFVRIAVNPRKSICIFGKFWWIPWANFPFNLKQ